VQPSGRGSLGADEFGVLLRLCRKQVGFTQERLAERSGLSVRAIRALEHGQGRPRPGTVRLLGDALGLGGSDRARFDAAAHRPDRDRPPAVSAVAMESTLAWLMPAQLPTDVGGFAGRTQYLRELDALLAGAGDGHGESGRVRGMAISAIVGPPGVGKTALAVHWAHQARDEFPDGQLYVNLRGFDAGGSAMTPAEAVRGFLDAFGIPPQRVPASLAAQAALYRSLLADRRMLVVLDNARDVEQVRLLLPGSPGCLVLVTSRNELSSLVAIEGAHPLTLDLLTTAEARQLLARRLGADRVAAEPHAVNQITASCARLPLALAIVAARASSHRGFFLAALAAELRQARGSLDVFDGGDASTDARAVFTWSYRTLSSEAARLFRLLGLHPGPDISAPAAASLAFLPVDRARRVLAELARASLLVEHTTGRFAFHDLLRAYATELAHSVDTGAVRHSAVHRVLDHYLHTAHSAALLLAPHGNRIIPHSSQPGATPEDLEDRERALAWLIAEHPVLLGAIRQAASMGFEAYTWQLAWTLGEFLDLRGHWHDLVAAQNVALDAARRLADRPGQAHAQQGLARAYERLGRHDDARTHYGHALRLYGELGDHTGQANVHLRLGGVFEREGGRYQEALHHAEQALELFRAAGDRSGQARTLNSVGWDHAQLGDHSRALAYCRQALTLLQEIGDRWGQAATWDSLGYVHHHLGDHGRAVACYQRALDLWREIGDRYNDAATLTRLGDDHHAAGDRTAAHDAWEHALRILDQLGHSDADRVRAKLRQLDHPPIHARAPTPT
jgi:tetratricopeptide (TPR) repeat protein/transcriptional regulator with XRE-family HTH domain